VNFADHLENHRRADGGYDLDAAEEDRRFEIETSPEEQRKLAAKAAHQEREAYVSAETAKLRKQLEQPALSPSLELDVMVPLGDGTVVPFGEMNLVRIRTRKDMRIQSHLRELRAFEAEMTHWLGTEQLLSGDETIEDAILRGGA
jgi:hypothetical protein